MGIRSVSLLALAAAAAVAVASPALAQNPAGVQRVLDRARTAMGGVSAWNGLRGRHETGRLGEARYELWTDPLRYGMRLEVTAADGSKVVSGYNGFGDWIVLADGGKTGSADEAGLAETRTDAFFATYAYFYPGRFEARSSLVGARTADGRTYDVVRMEPAGGEPRELWFDRRTGHLAVIVDETGPKQSRTELSDYRSAGEVTLPHRIVTYGGGRERSEERSVETVEFTPTDRAMFSLPREEAETPAP